MNPREILDELDRLGVVLWWQDLGNESSLPTLRFDSRKVPPELAEQIRLRTEELHKIVRWEPSKRAAGIRLRKPRPPGAGSGEQG